LAIRACRISGFLAFKVCRRVSRSASERCIGEVCCYWQGGLFCTLVHRAQQGQA
jgi:hypothetical protein